MVISQKEYEIKKGKTEVQQNVYQLFKIVTTEAARKVCGTMLQHNGKKIAKVLSRRSKNIYKKIVTRAKEGT